MSLWHPLAQAQAQRQAHAEAHKPAAVSEARGGRLPTVLMRHPHQLSVKTWGGEGEGGGGGGWGVVVGGGSAGGCRGGGVPKVGGLARDPLLPHAYLQGGAVDAMPPNPLSLKTRGGGGGWGVSHTRTGPAPPPPRSERGDTSFRGWGRSSQFSGPPFLGEAFGAGRGAQGLPTRRPPCHRPCPGPGRTSALSLTRMLAPLMSRCRMPSRWR